MADSPYDVSSMKDTVLKTAALVQAAAEDLGVPIFFANQIGMAVSVVVFVPGILLIGFLFMLKQIVIPVVVQILVSIEFFRTQASPEFSKVTAAVMGEFLGFDIDPGTLQGGISPKDQLARMITLGDGLHNLLTAEFGGNGAVTPESGAKAARAFTGYNMNFAATNAVTSVFYELASIDHLANIRELGVEVAENLGLGRMHRGAIKPLIDNLITLPYTKFMNNKYRQNSLNESALVHALLSGQLTNDVVMQHFRNKGYPDSEIAVLIEQMTPHLNPSEVEDMINYGLITEEQGEQQLSRNGWDQSFATTKLNAIRASNLLSMEHTYAEELVTMAKQRYITYDQLSATLDTLHVYDGEKQIYLARVNAHLNFQHKHLTISMMLYLLERNLLNSSDLDTWMAENGYNDRDAVAVELWITSKELEYDAAQEAKKKKAAGKGPTPPATG